MVGVTLWAVLDAAKIYPSLPLFVVSSLLLGAVPAVVIIRWVYRWVKSGAASPTGNQK
jgi:hypothetical protein